MLRGFDSVVGPVRVEPGRFYMQSHPSGGMATFMRARMPLAGEGHHQHVDLHFRPNDGHGLWFLEPSGYEPVIALPPVHVRVDPHSLLGSEFTTSIRAGMLCVSNTDVYAIGGWQTGYGSRAVNVSTGEATEPRPPSGWLAFAKWALVIDERDKEIVLAKFDRSPPALA